MKSIVLAIVAVLLLAFAGEAQAQRGCRGSCINGGGFGGHGHVGNAAFFAPTPIFVPQSFGFFGGNQFGGAFNPFFNAGFGGGFNNGFAFNPFLNAGFGGFNRGFAFGNRNFAVGFGGFNGFNNGFAFHGNGFNRGFNGGFRRGCR